MDSGEVNHDITTFTGHPPCPLPSLGQRGTLSQHHTTEDSATWNYATTEDTPQPKGFGWCENLKNKK